MLHMNAVYFRRYPRGILVALSGGLGIISVTLWARIQRLQIIIQALEIFVDVFWGRSELDVWAWLRSSGEVAVALGPADPCPELGQRTGMDSQV